MNKIIQNSYTVFLHNIYTIQWCRKEVESGGTRPAQTAGKNFCVVPLHFLALQVQLVVLVSAFVMVSTGWSVSCLLFFFLLTGPPCPAICKSEGARTYTQHKVTEGYGCVALCPYQTATRKKN